MIGLTWVGHATVVLDLGGARLLTDPLLRGHAGPLQRVGPAPEPASWAGTAAVLLSHLHHDHAEVSSLTQARGAMILTGDQNAGWVRRKVRSPVIGLAADQWHPVASDLEVRLVRADHAARPMPHRPNQAHGFLVRSAEHVVWFVGDSSLHAEMAAVPALAGARVDVALVPIGGWAPRLSPGHMGPADAAEACRLARPRAVLPIHHGTLHPRGLRRVGGLAWMARPLHDFLAEMTRHGSSVEVLTPGLGGRVEVA